MRTESFRRGLGSILLVSVIVFSMTLSMTCVAPPVLADAVISYPGHQLQPQNIFDVPQGHTFTLRHRLAWDEPSESGYCMVVIYWDYFGGNAYHFTLEGAVAYFDDDGDNLPDPGVAMIDNTVQTRDNGTMYVIGMSNTAGDWRDGEFNVDITLRASGPDGTPHAATDNHPIYYAIVQSLESVPPSTAVPLVTVRVLGRGVAVSISPGYQGGEPGATLSYAVTVKNTGIVEDNYDLIVTDSVGWGPSLSENRFENVAPGEDRVATLSVIIPSDALSGMEDSMTVTAISQSDPTVSDFGSCMARSVIPIPSPIPLGVTVSISPGLQSGVPMETLTYTVTVANTRIVGVTYDLVASDNAGWNPTVSPTSLTIAPGESATTTLSVTIPDDASSGAEDKITTTITSRTDPTWSDSATCIAHAIVPEAQRWDALITATFSGGSDDALFGVRSNATDNFDYVYDIPEPPAPPEPPYVRAYFYPGQIPDELHRSCLAPENLMEWPLRIEYAEGLEDITLTWNVQDVPDDYSIFLYRGENLVADMRAEDSYTFEALTGSYDFRLVVGMIVPFTLELTQSWNMISFPVLQENMSPDAIFDGYYVLYRWDARNKRYVLHADSGSFVEPDPDVDVGVGHWAYVLEDENVDLLGVPVDQLNLSLRQGWNLIGPPHGGSSIADPADNPDDSVLTWAFTWNSREKRYSMVQLLEAGIGYWAYALRDCTLELPSLFQPPQPGYPAITATSAKHGDNEIRINVVAGSIPALEWAYSVSTVEGSYSWIQGTEELDAPYVSLGTYASGTYYVSLKHIDSGHLYFYDQTITISYPAIIATSAKSGDNEIRINVSTGSIPAWEWAYSISMTEGSYSWTTGTEELDSPYVSLGTYAAGTYYVSLKHIYSGHFYFWDQTITISYPNF